ncbi:zf-HC2 domain-containing protein [Bacillota bacterium LX-D]|nr:zf-HC2 domain-containing protein [Bacillota bacterium LX-D]
MNCREIQEMLSAFIDTELTQSETLQVMEHLKFCSKCRQELLNLQKTIHFLRNSPELDLPADFHSNLSCKLRKVNMQKKPLNNISRYKLGTAVAAIFLIVVSTHFAAALNYKVESSLSTVEDGQKQKILSKQNQATIEKKPQVPPNKTKELKIESVENASPKKSRIEKNGSLSEKRPVETTVKSVIATAVSPKIRSEDGTFINLNDRNGFNLQTQEKSLSTAMSFIQDDVSVDTDYQLLVKEIDLHVKNIDQAREDVKMAAISMGGIILVQDQNYLEVSFPEKNLVRAIQAIEKHGDCFKETSSGQSAAKQVKQINKKQNSLYLVIDKLKEQLAFEDNQEVIKKIQEELLVKTEELNKYYEKLKTLSDQNVICKIKLVP